MKKVFFTLLVSLLATVSISAQSRVEERSMKSEILGVEKTFSVYLPDGYDDDNSTRYPVLYLLHGAFGQNTDWHTHADLQLIADRMIAADSVRPMIVVMPDARGVAKNLAGENMGYFNVEGWPYEDYFFEEFIPYIEKTFRVDTARESRAIAGLSMGGGGAVAYAQHHPELFCAAYSASGLLNMFPRKGISPHYAVPFLWSVVANSPVIYMQNATPEAIERLKTVRWMADCGDDDFLIRPNLDFFNEMLRRGVPMEFRVRDGSHSWKYWNSALPMILEFSFGTSRSK